jgi:ribose-phosphate pyrophosphokinase
MGNSATAILIDDIVSTGTTIDEAVRALKAAGARDVYAFATHARFREGTLEKINSMEGLTYLLVTNSIPLKLGNRSESVCLVKTARSCRAICSVKGRR